MCLKITGSGAYSLFIPAPPHADYLTQVCFTGRDERGCRFQCFHQEKVRVDVGVASFCQSDSAEQCMCMEMKVKRWHLHSCLASLSPSKPSGPSTLRLINGVFIHFADSAAWLQHLCRTLSHSSIAEVFRELWAAPSEAASIAAVFFSWALSSINGVCPDLNYHSERASLFSENSDGFTANVWGNNFGKGVELQLLAASSCYF